MTHTFEFDYEVEALGQSVTVTVTRTPPSFPGDPGPDGEGEIEVRSVTLNGFDVDTDGIKVVKKTRIYRSPFVLPQLLPEWFTLTELIRVAAWEAVEREAA